MSAIVQLSGASTRSADGGTTQVELDLFWQYETLRIALDFSQDQPPTDAGELIRDLEVHVQASIDGIDWTPAASTWRLATPRSTKGPGPTIVGIFAEAINLRYVRVISGDPTAEFDVRAFTTSNLRRVSEAKQILLGVGDDVPTNGNGPPSRVVPIGDSNTVMRFGWKRAFSGSRWSRPFEAALGASSNIAFGHTLTPEKIEGSKFALINANVVEYGLLNREGYDWSLGDDAIKHALSLCASQSVQAIRIIWPHLGDYDKDRAVGPIGTSDYFPEQCERLGLAYIDGVELLRVLARLQLRQPSTYFKDDAHVAPYAAQVLGAAIANWLHDEPVVQLEDLAASARRPARTLTSVSIVSQHTSARIVEVNNSLIQQRLLDIPIGDPLQVNIPHGFEVVGYLVDAVGCSASIEIEGTERLVKRVDYPRASLLDSDRHFVCVRPLPHAIRPLGASVTIRAVSPLESHLPDPLVRKSIVDGATEYPEPQIRIGALVIRSIAEDTHYYAQTKRSLNRTAGVVEKLCQLFD